MNGKKGGFLRFWHSTSLTLVRSVSDLRFFREARHRRPRQAAGHLAVLVILFWVVPFAIVFFSAVRQGLDAAIGGLRRHVPPGAEFRMKDGELSTTLEAPIVIREGGAAFIVNTSTTTLELGEDEIGVVVGPRELVQQEAPGRRQIVSYKDVPNFETTREGIDAWIGRHAKWFVLIAAAIAIPLFFIVMAVGYGAYVLAHAAALWFAFRLLRRPLPFTEAFVLSAFAATAPVAAKAVFSWSGIEIGPVPTFLYWILLAFIAYDLAKGGGREASTHGEEKNSRVEGPRPDAA